MAPPYDRFANERWVKGVIEAPDTRVWVNEEAVALQGTCGRCGHQLDDFIPLHLGYAKRFAHGPAQRAHSRFKRDERMPTVLSCNCAAEHSGRPEGALGCGSYGGLIVHLEAGTRGWCGWKKPDGPRVFLTPDAARTEEKRWDDDAAQLERDQLARIRGSAGKWAATVTAVLGVFSVATLVEGAEQIQKLVDTEGTRVRWLGLFAALAALAALSATAYAAQGIPRPIHYVTGAKLRLRRRANARRAVWAIWLGAFASFLSALLVIAALALLLSADQKPAPTGLIRIETSSGDALCGTTRQAAPDQVAVNPPEGGRSGPVPFAEVQQITQVAECN